MKKIIFLTLVFGYANCLFSQSITPQVISSAGNYAEGTNVSISWTLGEVATETIGNNDNIITQGFHQPDYNIVVIEHIESPQLDVTIYPNPTNGLLNIEWKGNDNSTAVISLFDLTGKQIINQKVSETSSIGQIDITGLANSTYILQIISEDAKLKKDFRIVKE